ncbi:MAG: 4Fe-4S binding protein [Rhodothermales bacterium]|nr:4Fe-4S binding protein [Rhodothermales bacterium]
MYRITAACTACGLCVDVCPIGAIEVAEPIYVIDETCCDFEECVAECPEQAIVPLAESVHDD